MKKVLIITNLYPPYTRGGAEQVAFMQANLLAQDGFEVSVISTHPNFFSTNKLENGVIVYRFKPLNIFYYLNDYKYNIIFRLIWRVIDTFNIFAMFDIHKIIRNNRPDIIITHNLVGIGLLTSLLIKITKIKHIHTLHDVQLVKPSGLLKNITDELNKLEYLYTKITRKIFGNVDICVSPSKALLDFHISNNLFLNSNNYVLRNPLTMEVDNKPVVKNNKSKLLYIGQLEDHKGIIELINAIGEVKNENISLDIIGDGKLSGAIEIAAENMQNINYHGRLNHYEVSSHIENAAYVVVPSQTFENSPTVIYESFSKGIPVIASKIGGIPELVKNEKTGFLYKNLKQLPKVINEAVNISDSEYTNLSKNCLEFTSENSSEKYLRRLKRFF